MRRNTIAPRADWQRKVEAQGLVWHTTDGPAPAPYWDESAFYSFTTRQITEIEDATAELYGMFLEAGQAVLDDPAGLDVFRIPRACHAAIRSAWNDEPPALNYGRFDLGYDGKGPPKLFEFNCDTPTSLLEAAVIQWEWKEEVLPRLDQFNSLHERLVAKWADIAPLIPSQRLVFAHTADQAGEDIVTTSYLRDTAQLGGLRTDGIVMEDIGWHGVRRCFVDTADQPIDALFKLYPWEWIVNEEFGRHALGSIDRTIWIEPIWKMIWSNKAILPVLWSMFPDHPNLLPASFGTLPGDYVRKPLLAREGANVSIVRGNATEAQTGGDYGAEGYVYQALYELPGAGMQRPVVGSWVVDGAPAGIGIREDGAITGNTARFVPHVIE